MILDIEVVVSGAEREKRSRGHGRVGWELCTH